MRRLVPETENMRGNNRRNLTSWITIFLETIIEIDDIESIMRGVNLDQNQNQNEPPSDFSDIGEYLTHLTFCRRFF
ncbi:MAG: hypothetical protein ISQ34_02065 [Rickettsiales bacterium]|nr:hypothetical protein [Rickettsiales bacterium]